MNEENINGIGPGESFLEGELEEDGSIRDSGLNSLSIGSEIILNMSILMIAAIVLIAIMINWMHSYLIADYITYARFLLIPYVIMFALTVAVFGWRLISKLILAPLRELLDATHQVADGDLSTRVHITENNEMGRLSAAFNEMTSRLEKNSWEVLHSLEQTRRLNQNLAQTQSELLSSEKLASVGRLAAGVAHEIGNPLSAIAGYMDILSRRDYLEGRDREMTERIQDEVKRISEIIKELLDYSRPQDKSVSSIGLNEYINSSLTLMSGQKGFDKIEVDLRLGEIPDFMANYSSVQQLIMNLVLNAVHVMPDGGKLTIATETAKLEGRDGVELTVTDTGPGIAAELLDKIFDPFFTTKDPGQGTGLGLSICMGIVENMKGKISVESNTGRGAIFKVWLPAADGEESD